MPMTTFREFCDGVLGQMPRATGRERDDIREELLDHLMEHRDMLMDHGVEELEAERRAIEAMGDATEIGRAWNKTLSPLWLWLGRVCAAVFVLIFLFNASDVYYKVDRLVDSLSVRYGDATTSDHRDLYDYELIWETRPDIQKPFGEHIISIDRVELYERSIGKERFYAAQVYYVSWHKDPFGHSLNLGVLMNSEKYGPEVIDSGGGGSQAAYATWARDHLKLDKGLESLKISFDHYGNHFEAEIPLDWGGASA